MRHKALSRAVKCLVAAGLISLLTQAMATTTQAEQTRTLKNSTTPAVLRVGSTERAETSNPDLAVDPTSLIILHLTGG